MGIPYLYKWLKNKNFPAVLRKNVPRYVSSLSLDANGIIHKCAQLVYAYGEGENPARQKLIAQADARLLEAEFHNSISTLLHQLLSQVQPQELLMIAIDGVAPQSKIAQQRQRRFKSAMGNTSEIFDSSCISPGTDFMIRLDNFLQRWIATYQSTLPPKVIYSSHMVPNEGEAKIIDMMRNGNISGSGVHVIYGMDADLIMLSLLAPIEKISLMREDISSIIDIDNLRFAIKENIGNIDDFVVMIFLLGNDFLPQIGRAHV